MFSKTNSVVSGELPDLLTHLALAYVEARATPSVPAADLLHDHFIQWAKAYLDANRPSEFFSVDNNGGVLLTNGVRIKLCPDGATALPSGSMANPDNSVSVSRLG